LALLAEKAGDWVKGVQALNKFGLKEALMPRSGEAFEGTICRHIEILPKV
jgi:hypothetical protein